MVARKWTAHLVSREILLLQVHKLFVKVLRKFENYSLSNNRFVLTENLFLVIFVFQLTCHLISFFPTKNSEQNEYVKSH